MNELHYVKRLKTLGYWEKRIAKQIEFAEFLCTINPSLSIDTLHEVSHFVASAHKKEGSITRDCVMQAESRLSYYSPEAKSFTVDCIGHAHIDMNWMWGFDETVSIVLDTFRTMLRLMEEYSDFTFAQSQASTYYIVEKYEPEMIEEIRKRVKEGRWEVTASAWTEFDKNMTSGESELRQYKVASEYICQLLDINPGLLTVGFEPDTFGHNERLPDILTLSGIKYYYHCRGDVNHNLYTWEGPQGGKVIAFREPTWYLGPSVTPLNDASKGTIKTLEMDMVHEIAQMYHTNGIRRILQVYGVGDHGGGPTRIDIEGLIDLASWPCYPKVMFSTIKNFFENISEYSSNLPIVTGEINSIFPGCYTSQSEIKRGNHECEKMLYEAELFSSVENLYRLSPPKSLQKDPLEKAWQDLFFNQFHDILPGSCTQDSKAYSLGLYQSITAEANTIRTHGIRAIAQAIDTSAIVINRENGQRAVGAGVGYQNNEFKVSPIGNIEGTKRIVTLFNATGSYQNKVAEVVLWDWENITKDIACCDENGNNVITVTKPKQMTYWQHSASFVYIPVLIPPYGHASYVFYPGKKELNPVDVFFENPRKEEMPIYILDNGIIRATFSSENLTLLSLLNVSTNEELLSGPSGITFLEEDAVKGMTAWLVGRENRSLDELFKVSEATIIVDDLRQELSYTIMVRSSLIHMNYILHRGSNCITCKIKTTWKEIGNESLTPQLSFSLHVKDTRERYLYDIPFGIIKREASPMHVPALSFAAGKVHNSIVQLISRGKYGFCCSENTMRVILLRSSSDPDKFPEVGEHQQQIAICVHQAPCTHKQLIETSTAVSSDLQQVTHGQHSGILPMYASYLTVDGPFIVTAIHQNYHNQSIVVRGYETEGIGGKVSIKLSPQISIKEARIMGKEEKIPTLNHNTLVFESDPYEIVTISLVPNTEKQESKESEISNGGL